MDRRGLSVFHLGKKEKKIVEPHFFAFTNFKPPFFSLFHNIMSSTLTINTSTSTPAIINRNASYAILDTSSSLQTTSPPSWNRRRSSTTSSTQPPPATVPKPTRRKYGHPDRRRDCFQILQSIIQENERREREEYETMLREAPEIVARRSFQPTSILVKSPQTPPASPDTPVPTPTNSSLPFSCTKKQRQSVVRFDTDPPKVFTSSMIPKRPSSPPQADFDVIPCEQISGTSWWVPPLTHPQMVILTHIHTHTHASFVNKRNPPLMRSPHISNIFAAQ